MIAMGNRKKMCTRYNRNAQIKHFKKFKNSKFNATLNFLTVTVLNLNYYCCLQAKLCDIIIGTRGIVSF